MGIRDGLEVSSTNQRTAFTSSDQSKDPANSISASRTIFSDDGDVVDDVVGVVVEEVVDVVA